jgi:hypothetical protein
MGERDRKKTAVRAAKRSRPFAIRALIERCPEKPEEPMASQVPLDGGSPSFPSN